MTDYSLAPIAERVLFENEHVRVWENIVEVGEELQSTDTITTIWPSISRAIG